MPRKPSSHKFQLTINNPTKHGYDHSRIKSILAEFSGAVYWCMCDEIGEQGTPHTHVYLVCKNSVMFDTLHKRFFGAHIEAAKGTHQENRDYIRKEGKWMEDAKHETNLADTFEEWGEMPPDRSKRETQSEQIMQMVHAGKSNAEILTEIPGAFSKLNYIEQARQTLLEDRYRNEWRNLEVNYIWGQTRSGKTRSVMDTYGYANVYRVTDYAHPFDSYKGQDVILFDEFRSSLPLASMLTYLEGYPIMLPCRYANKVACFTKVFLISNIPLNQQYPNVQREEPESWNAFRRRINNVRQMDNDFRVLDNDPGFDPDSVFSVAEV